MMLGVNLKGLKCKLKRVEKFRDIYIFQLGFPLYYPWSLSTPATHITAALILYHGALWEPCKALWEVNQAGLNTTWIPQQLNPHQNSKVSATLSDMVTILVPMPRCFIICAPLRLRQHCNDCMVKSFLLLYITPVRKLVRRFTVCWDQYQTDDK